jgi:hypothetical protein
MRGCWHLADTIPSSGLTPTIPSSGLTPPATSRGDVGMCLRMHTGVRQALGLCGRLWWSGEGGILLVAGGGCCVAQEPQVTQQRV